MTVGQLCARAATITGIDRANLFGRDAHKKTGRARRAIIYVARTQLYYSYRRIGMCLDNRDHSTIRTAFHNAERDLGDQTFAALVEELAG